MKKILSLLLTIALCFTLAPSTASAAVKISKTKATVYIGMSLKLKISGSTKYVMWKSSDKAVAKVSSKGTVSGVGEGTSIITATIGSGSNNQKLTCLITVKPRLSTDNTDVTCLLDEYEEILINFEKPKDDESLVCISNGKEVADTEWADDDENYVLRIIPQSIGKISVSICTMTGSTIWDEEIHRDEELLINITVLQDLKWISSSDLSALDISDLIVKTYYIENSETPIENNVIYNDDGLVYKYDGQDVYYRIDSLKQLGIM